MTKETDTLQLPLALGHDPAADREHLLVSASIAPAVDLVDRWPEWRAPVTVLSGPAGSGKSHLSAIWKGMSEAHDVTDNLRAGRPIPYRQGAFLFEDADRAEFDQTALFHLINTVRQNSGSLLITARSAPGLWDVTLADLRSRLQAATLVEIGAPDDALLQQVIVKLFSDRQLEVDQRVVTYLVSRMERSLDAACRIVDQIDRLALARGRRITRALAAEVLTARENAV
ncbi:DnaA regulatory inactivator HdaA [uncultured Martelella sp.]|uniref:DnaA regulatory inactivator HdaA n=1 Tax=uncultured Martelella sp. TaxID=392331 RepID=UPI0029C6AF29|nr:DnaA regulatory inactivator HdaA [uncultured Martelella sp.]